jgi:hypothetical protein
MVINIIYPNREMNKFLERRYTSKRVNAFNLDEWAIKKSELRVNNSNVGR